MKLKIAISVVLLSCTVLPTWAIDVDLYGSLRFGFESVNPDGDHDEYTGIRDASSRIGVKATQEIDKDWSVIATLEVPFDSANLEIQLPGNPDEDVRVANVKVKSPYGTLEYGQGWLPYYNHIAASVDQLSSYYSGWATFANSRKKETLAYSSPDIHGFKFAFASSGDTNDLPDRHTQYVAAYSNSSFTVAVGHDDRGEGSYANNGVAVSYTTGPWHFAVKYEEMDSDDQYDGQTFQNLLVQYKLDEKNTLRTVISEGEVWNYGDSVYHLGWDYRYDDSLKFFVEYYQEESPAAISAEAGDPGPVVGGNVLTTGIYYDFSL